VGQSYIAQSCDRLCLFLGLRSCRTEGLGKRSAERLVVDIIVGTVVGFAAGEVVVGVDGHTEAGGQFVVFFKARIGSERNGTELVAGAGQSGVHAAGSDDVGGGLLEGVEEEAGVLGFNSFFGDGEHDLVKADLDRVDVLRERKGDGDFLATALGAGGLETASAGGEVEITEIATVQGQSLAQRTVLADVITGTSCHGASSRLWVSSWHLAVDS